MKSHNKYRLQVCDFACLAFFRGTTKAFVSGLKSTETDIFKALISD